MKTYQEEKVIPVNAVKAWEALKSMEQWLPQLKSITRLDYDKAKVFFFEGREYKVHTPEGVIMESTIAKVDEQSYKVQINAHCFILKSKLTCQVVPIDENSCKIVRIQSYPGIVGTIFTTLFHRREANETGQYVDVWSEFAMRSKLKLNDARLESK